MRRKSDHYLFVKWHFHSFFAKMWLAKQFNLHKCETSSGFATFLEMHHQHQIKKRKNFGTSKMPFRVKLQFIPTILLVWISVFFVCCTAQLKCKSLFSYIIFSNWHILIMFKFERTDRLIFAFRILWKIWNIIMFFK